MNQQKYEPPHRRSWRQMKQTEMKEHKRIVPEWPLEGGKWAQSPRLQKNSMQKLHGDVMSKAEVPTAATDRVGGGNILQSTPEKSIPPLWKLPRDVSGSCRRGRRKQQQINVKTLKTGVSLLRQIGNPFRRTNKLWKHGDHQITNQPKRVTELMTVVS